MRDRVAGAMPLELVEALCQTTPARCSGACLPDIENLRSRHPRAFERLRRNRGIPAFDQPEGWCSEIPGPPPARGPRHRRPARSAQSKRPGRRTARNPRSPRHTIPRALNPSSQSASLRSDARRGDDIVCGGRSTQTIAFDPAQRRESRFREAVVGRSGRYTTFFRLASQTDDLVRYRKAISPGALPPVRACRHPEACPARPVRSPRHTASRDVVRTWLVEDPARIQRRAAHSRSAATPVGCTNPGRRVSRPPRGSSRSAEVRRVPRESVGRGVLRRTFPAPAAATALPIVGWSVGAYMHHQHREVVREGSKGGCVSAVSDHGRAGRHQFVVRNEPLDGYQRRRAIRSDRPRAGRHDQLDIHSVGGVDDVLQGRALTGEAAGAETGQHERRSMADGRFARIVHRAGPGPTCTVVGVPARGVWVAVRAHQREIGLPPQSARSESLQPRASLNGPRRNSPSKNP